MTRPIRPPAGGAPVQPWTPGSTPGGVTCPTCGLANEPGARVCRNCGLPIAAQNDPLRGVAAGSVEMPSAQRAGISATIGLGLVVVLLLVAGTLAVSGGGILSSGGRIGIADDASPSPTPVPDGVADPGEDTPGTVGTVEEPGNGSRNITNASEYSCVSGAIRDPGRGRWTIVGPSPSSTDDADRLTFRMNRRSSGKASTATVVRLEWMTPDEAAEAFGLSRVAGDRALVLTFEGPSRITNNSRLLASELEAAGTDVLRSVDVVGGDDGDVQAVIGVRGQGCARMSAAKWTRKATNKVTRMFLDVQREDAAATDA